MIRLLGAMSGTSGDGVDAVLLEIDRLDAPGTARVVDHTHHPFSDALRAELMNPMAWTVEQLASLHATLPDFYAEALCGLEEWQTAEACGMHGQTVFHAPPSRSPVTATSLQIGSSGMLAQRLQMPVVADMRAADLAWGGEGAPIAPVAHWLLTAPDDVPRWVVNVGGIANGTWVAQDAEQMWGEDFGPGMMLLDGLVRRLSGGRLKYDEQGDWARRGAVRDDVLTAIREHSFFGRPHPRTTGREDFGANFLDTLLRRFPEVLPEDWTATALEATALCIAAGCGRADDRPREILLTGGGALHPGLLPRVAARIPDVPVRVAHDGCFAPAYLEAAAMAVIAGRTLRGWPSAFPRVTGASRAAILGHIHYPTLK